MDEAAFRQAIWERCVRNDLLVQSQNEAEEKTEEEERIEEESRVTEEIEKNESETDLEDILAETRRKYNAKEEFIYLLYNDILEYFINEWDGHKLVKKRKIELDMEDEEAEVVFENVVEIGNQKFDRWWGLKLPDELANVKFFNGNTYSGRVSRRMMEGKGSYRWKNGVQYTGDFAENRIEGKGRLEWNNDCWYEGEFLDGSPHGKGTMVDRENRCMYTGEWRLGLKHGSGYCRYANGDSYEGGWIKNRMEGHGLRVYASGSKYAGEFKNGVQHGTGTMVWVNGDIYRGEWKYGKMNGRGEYTWNAFLNKNLSWPRETSYVGEWCDGMRHGEGLLRLNTRGGAKYCGHWKANKKHGSGMIIGNNGESIEADPLFLDGVLVSLSIIDFRKDESERAITWMNKLMKVTTALPIPILKPEQLPPLSYHLLRLSRMKDTGFDWTDEERQLYNSLTTHMPRLWKIYNDYANAFARAPPASDLVMTRFSLWQLWRDTGINEKNLSLAEIDRCVAENKDARVEDPRHPFESIEIWQFIHTLIEVSWLVYTVHDDIRDGDANGKLAAGLNRLLELDVFPNLGNHVGKLCNGYIDVLPICCVFDFYRDIGHPVLARDLLCSSCHLKDSPSLQPSIYCTSTVVLDHLLHGTNARIMAGERISYIPENEQERFKIIPQQSRLKTQNCRVNGLLAFRDLSVKKMVQVIEKVCPSIKDKETSLLVYMDYELTFLEFYEILLEATIELLSTRKITIEQPKMNVEMKTEEVQIPKPSPQKLIKSKKK